jgi:hypothetical protein
MYKHSVELVLFVSAIIITSTFSELINSYRVYAHNFTPDETASFLSVINRIKNETQLIQSNFLSNATNNSGRTLAQQHTQNAIAILNQTWTKEIAERNNRVAHELTIALIDLNNATTTTKSKPDAANDIKDMVSNLNNLLDEAISVRLTKDQVNNSTIQALAFANIVNKIDRRYANAFGAESNDMSSAMNMGGAKAMSNATMSNAAMSNNKSMSSMDMMMANMMKNDQPNSKMTSSGNNKSSQVLVKLSDYQSAVGLTNKATELLSILKTKAPYNKASAIADLESSLAQLKSAVYAKKPYMDVMIIIHTKVHPMVMNAFNLRLA